VWHDLLGLTPGQLPRFVKQYAQLADPIGAALRTYAEDVRTGIFPGPEHCHGMPDADREEIRSADRRAAHGSRQPLTSVTGRWCIRGARGPGTGRVS
jgi:hypothetical protein